MLLFRRTVADGRSRIRAMCESLRPSFRDESEAQGLKLLREWLSLQQLAQFDANGFFDVVGCDTQRRYRIHYGSAANIDELDDRDCPLISYCFVPEAPLVPGDVMLAQKIALETDERAALAVACQFMPKARQRISMSFSSMPIY
jgi:hypothetical protein